MQKQITSTQGDSEGTIDSLINFLQDAKSLGATHYKMRWSGDPVWAFKYFETYKTKTEEEIKNEKINSLKEELRNLGETI